MSQRNPLFIVIFALFAAACAPQKSVKKTPPPPGETQLPGSGGGTAMPERAPTETGEANLRGTAFAEVPELESIHFDYDSYALGEAAREILKKNAEYLKAHGDLSVLTAGNCDERGTVGYNLALGQKRAQSVRDYYIRLGISGGNIATISYGKEKPLCTQSNEECWTKNRRTDTLARARAQQKGSSSR